MITDSIKNRALYEKSHPLFNKAFDFIEEYMKNPLENGSYKICGDDVYANIFDCTTKTDGVYEAHRKYIDIQFIVRGKEKVKCEYIDRLTPTCEFNEEGDYGFYEATEGNTEFVFEEGYFAVFYPQDGHMPSIAIGEPSTTKKIVVKVKCM